MMILDSPDGEGAKKLEMIRNGLSEELIASITLEAHERYQQNPPALEVGQLICTVAFGVEEDRQFKIFEIYDETVVIALRDMGMKIVSKKSLYDQDLCLDIFWERPL